MGRAGRGGQWKREKEEEKEGEERAKWEGGRQQAATHLSFMAVNVVKADRLGTRRKGEERARAKVLPHRDGCECRDGRQTGREQRTVGELGVPGVEHGHETARALDSGPGRGAARVDVAGCVP